MSVSPRPAESIASVTTKAGTPNQAITVPDTAPASIPTPSPAAITRSAGYGPPGTMATEDVLASDPATTPVSATSEPTERSIPRVRITKVMPIARIPLIEVWRSTLRILFVVRKY